MHIKKVPIPPFETKSKEFTISTLRKYFVCKTVVNAKIADFNDEHDYFASQYPRKQWCKLLVNMDDRLIVPPFSHYM